ALRKDHEVTTAGRGQDLDRGDVTAAELVQAAGGADLLLVIEGENYVPRDLEDAPCPTAWWAIDNHLHARTKNGWHFKVGESFDHVFCAQRDYVPRFVERGIDATWLPLACDPDVHDRHNVRCDLDVVFVGNVLPIHERRRDLLERLQKRFKVTI